MIRLRFGPFAFFLFVGLFALESWLFLEVGQRLGLLPVLAWVFISFVLGVVLIRVEGLRMLFSMHVQLQRGVVPAREMLGTLAVVLGGLLLMLPGYFTDALGLLLLFPPTRALLWFLFSGALVRATGMESPERPARRPSEEVIEIEAQHVENGSSTR